MYHDRQIVHPQPGFLISRRWSRYVVDVHACLIAQKFKKAVIIPGRGSALNAGGMTIFAGVELAIGEEVTVAFTPPHCAESMSFRCIVRNRRGYTYGVEFMQDGAHNSNARMENILDAMAQTFFDLLKPAMSAAQDPAADSQTTAALIATASAVSDLQLSRPAEPSSESPVARENLLQDNPPANSSDPSSTALALPIYTAQIPSSPSVESLSPPILPPIL